MGYFLFAHTLVFGVSYFVALFVLNRFARYFLSIETVDQHIQKHPAYKFAAPRHRRILSAYRWHFVSIALALAAHSYIYGWVVGNDPVFLKVPRASLDLNRLDWSSYASRFEYLAERAKEKEMLADFLDGAPVFLWWSISGVPGSGEASLAADWLRTIDKRHTPCVLGGHDAGFLQFSSAPEWRTWQPRCRTTIVVEDVVENADETSALLRWLAEKSDSLKHPVRVLLLEPNMPYPEGMAERNIFLRHLHQREPVPLGELDSYEEFRSLVVRIATAKKSKISISSGQQKKILRATIGLPLFTAVMTDNLIDTGSVSWSNRQDLLYSEAERIASKLLLAGLPRECLRFLALATLTHGLPWDEVGVPGCIRRDVAEAVLAQDASQRLPPVKPAILGSFFLLDHFGKLSEQEQRGLIHTAWATDPRSTSYSLLELNRGLSDDPSISAIDAAPAEPLALAWWIFSRNMLLTEKIESEKNWEKLVAVSGRAIEQPARRALAFATANFISTLTSIHADEFDQSWRLITSLSAESVANDPKTLEHLVRGALSAIRLFGEAGNRKGMEEAIRTIDSLTRNPEETNKTTRYLRCFSRNYKELFEISIDSNNNQTKAAAAIQRMSDVKIPSDANTEEKEAVIQEFSAALDDALAAIRGTISDWQRLADLEMDPSVCDGISLESIKGYIGESLENFRLLPGEVN